MAKGKNTKKQKVQEKESIFKVIMDYAICIAIAFVISMFITHFIFCVSKVDGDSMYPTFENNDRLITEMVTYRFQEPKRFDSIVFHPDMNDKSEFYVKRIIGLPGETIQIKDTKVYINGKLLEENPTYDVTEYAGIAEDEITIPKDSYFVMGDNREVSLDSRYEEVGIVEKEQIVGKNVLRIMPLSKIGTVE